MKKANRLTTRGKRSPSLQIELLEQRHFLSANPIITEVMASNDGALLDGYGAENDWVEILNAGDQSVDLANYRLTDNLNNLSKWIFPSRILEPGQYLIVFASSRDEVDPEGNLHTNFGLSADGESIALVDPFGSVISHFEFPAQGSNESYGLGFDSTTTEAIAPSTPSKYFVPSDNSLDPSWMLPEFDDSAWTTGTSSLGYEAAAGLYASLIQTPLPIGTQSVYVRIPFAVSDADVVVGNLRMKFDDGFAAYLNGVEVARQHAVGTLGFDSQATEFQPKESAILDEIFNLSSYTHLLQVGENVLAIHVLDAASSPTQDLLIAPSLTLSSGMPRSPELVGKMISPTPGAPNTNITASEVLFSRVGGAYAGSIALELSSSGSGEVIRYTTNGSDPTATSPIYAGPININTSVKIRARAFGPEGQVGKVRTEAYTLVVSEFVGFTSDLPIVVLENFGAGVPDREFEPAMFALYETNESTGRSALGDLPTLTSEIAQHRRGSSTYNNPKSNLRIEFRDEFGQDKGVELLGMPEESDWILYAPYTQDRAMMRNVIMYDLSGQIVDYAIRTRFVEVFANFDGGALDSNDYMGVYVLLENIKRDDNRVAIDQLTPADINEPEITGGYIIKIDRFDEEEDASWDALGTPQAPYLVHVDPSRSEMTQAQVDYIRDYITEFETALYGSNWKDPNLGYAAYIDVDSFVDHHLLRIFSKEKDMLSGSEHYYKPRGGKLTAGPAWDFDRSSGSEASQYLGAEGWLVVGSNEAKVFRWGWWRRLFDDPNFVQKWVDRWQELRETVYSDANLTATVLGHASQIEEAQARNAARWPLMAPNGGAYADPESEGWEAEVSNLANWLLARAAWMDQQFVAPPSIEPSIEGLPSDGLVTLVPNHPTGTTYYTLDGSDPRASGGGVSPSAKIYTGPIQITGTTQVNARTFSPPVYLSAWSGMSSMLYATEVPADASNLRITEFHYHPANPTAAELLAAPGAEDNSFEFIELLNVSNQMLDLSGLRFTSGVDFDFDDGNVLTLAPGGTVLVVSNITAFEARYGTGLTIAGAYSGQLSNSGERLALVNNAGATIFDFTFFDTLPWPTSPDGDGPTLHVIDPFGNLNSGANWRASSNSGGNPGVASFAATGDYDRNGVVDSADYVTWRGDFGTTVAVAGDGSDGNRDGFVNAADYVLWRDRLSASGSSAGGAAALEGAETGSGAAASTEVSSPPPVSLAFSAGPAEQTPITKARSGLASSSQAADSSDRLLLLLANDRVRRVSGDRESAKLRSELGDHSDDPANTAISVEEPLEELWAAWK